MEDTLHQILEKHGFWQTIRTTSWVVRFIQTCKKRHEVQVVCPLSTSETDKQVKFCVRRVQNSRQLTKTIIKGCYRWRKFQVTAFSNPPAGKLPPDKTEGSASFQVVGPEFAGPIGYKLKTKKQGKAYILLFAWSLTRAVDFELQPNQKAEAFIKHLKRFIKRKGHPRKIYEYNKRTFVGGA